MNKTLLAALVAATAIGAAAPAAVAQPYGYHHFHRHFGYGPHRGWRRHWHHRGGCYRHPGAC